MSLMMNEQQYRSVKRKSYSYVADFLKDRRKFHKEHILGEKKEFEHTKDTRIGSAVDCLISEPELFDEKFFISDNDKIPEGKGGAFVKELFKLNELGGQFYDNARIAYDLAELKTPTFDKYMDKFEGSNLEEALTNLVQSKSKIILSRQEQELSKFLHESLINHPIVGRIFSGDGFYQLPIIFEHGKLELKGLLDRVCVDDDKKLISPYDLKVTFEDELFEFKWLKDKYYIQQGMYEKAVIQWRNENYPDYEIAPFRFVVINSSGLGQPLVYELTPEDGDLEIGFTTKIGRRYKGFAEVIRDIDWHIEKDIWNISKENYGKMNYIKRTV